jgi:hypothetical protein
MMDFNEYLTQKGMPDPEVLIVFLEQFGNNPAMLFELSDDERLQIEEQMDAALNLLLA